MELIATFVQRRVAFLLLDAKTIWGPKLQFANDDTMIAGLVKLGADETELRQQVRAWGQGSIHVRPRPEQVKWLLSR